jgi:hypothetical protein
MHPAHSAGVHLEPRMFDLAPYIHRQRMVMEFRRDAGWVTEGEIREYSAALAAADALDMHVIDLSVTMAAGCGFAGMCHWDFSGWSLMAWDQAGNRAFATIDLHSCKPFDYQLAVTATHRVFRPDVLVWKPVFAELGNPAGKLARTAGLPGPPGDPAHAGPRPGGSRRGGAGSMGQPGLPAPGTGPGGSPPARVVADLVPGDVCRSSRLSRESPVAGRRDDRSRRDNRSHRAGIGVAAQHPGPGPARHAGPGRGRIRRSPARRRDGMAPAHPGDRRARRGSTDRPGRVRPDVRKRPERA